MSKKPLPRSLDQLTASWLEEALGERFPGITVNSMEVVQAIYGTSTKVRVKVSYGNHPGPGGPPESLCIKGGFDDKLREFKFMEDLYELEGHFYGELAPKLKLPLIPCWYAAAEGGQGIIVLDDLTAQGVQFPRPANAWTPDRVKRSLEYLAKLHAQTWGVKPADYPWLFKSWEELHSVSEGCLKDDVWNAMMARPDAKFIPEAQRDRERIRRAFRATEKLMEQGQPHCVVHFDATINNTYIDAATGDPRYCDWQCCAIGPFMIDVPYVIAGGLTVKDRRKHEVELFAYYLECLKKEGGPSYTVEGKWLDYRRFEMGMGWLWLTCSLLMQPADTVAAMTERHATAIADHDTLGVLGV